MPAKGTKRLTEQKFNTIAAQAKKFTNIDSEIAEVNGVKLSTVRTIRKAGTWEEYQRRKEAAAEKAKTLRELNQKMEAHPIPQHREQEVTLVTAPWWAFWRRG